MDLPSYRRRRPRRASSSSPCPTWTRCASTRAASSSAGAGRPWISPELPPSPPLATANPPHRGGMPGAVKDHARGAVSAPCQSRRRHRPRRRGAESRECQGSRPRGQELRRLRHARRSHARHQRVPKLGRVRRRPRRSAAVSSSSRDDQGLRTDVQGRRPSGAEHDSAALAIRRSRGNDQRHFLACDPARGRRRGRRNAAPAHDAPLMTTSPLAESSMLAALATPAAFTVAAPATISPSSWIELPRKVTSPSVSTTAPFSITMCSASTTPWTFAAEVKRASFRMAPGAPARALSKAAVLPTTMSTPKPNRQMDLIRKMRENPKHVDLRREREKPRLALTQERTSTYCLVTQMSNTYLAT